MVSMHYKRIRPVRRNLWLGGTGIPTNLIMDSVPGKCTNRTTGLLRPNQAMVKRVERVSCQHELQFWKKSTRYTKICIRPSDGFSRAQSRSDPAPVACRMVEDLERQCAHAVH